MCKHLLLSSGRLLLVSGRLITWLGVYESAASGVAVGDNPTVGLDLDNEPQPDVVLLIKEECGGKVSPKLREFVVEKPV